MVDIHHGNYDNKHLGQEFKQAGNGVCRHFCIHCNTQTGSDTRQHPYIQSNEEHFKAKKTTG